MGVFVFDFNFYLLVVLVDRHFELFDLSGHAVEFFVSGSQQLVQSFHLLPHYLELVFIFRLSLIAFGYLLAKGVLELLNLSPQIFVLLLHDVDVLSEVELVFSHFAQVLLILCRLVLDGEGQLVRFFDLQSEDVVQPFDLLGRSRVLVA